MKVAEKKETINRIRFNDVLAKTVELAKAARRKSNTLIAAAELLDEPARSDAMELAVKAGKWNMPDEMRELFEKFINGKRKYLVDQKRNPKLRDNYWDDIQNAGFEALAQAIDDVIEGKRHAGDLHLVSKICKRIEFAIVEFITYALDGSADRKGNQKVKREYDAKRKAILKDNKDIHPEHRQIPPPFFVTLGKFDVAEKPEDSYGSIFKQLEDHCTPQQHATLDVAWQAFKETEDFNEVAKYFNMTKKDAREFLSEMLGDPRQAALEERELLRGKPLRRIY